MGTIEPGKLANIVVLRKNPLGDIDNLRTIGELVAAAKAKAGKIRVGSSGIGTGTHLGAEKFNLEAGIKAVHVRPSGGRDSSGVTRSAIV